METNEVTMMSNENTTPSSKSEKNIKEETPLKSLGEYNREVSKELPKSILKKEPTRLKYGLMFSVGMGLCIYAVMALNLPWFAKLPIAILMGIFSAGNTFLAHEVLHGAIVKNKKLQKS